MSKALDGVVELLVLEQSEVNIFRGRSPAGERRLRVFGGQVAGPARVAAGRDACRESGRDASRAHWGDCRAATKGWGGAQRPRPERR